MAFRISHTSMFYACFCARFMRVSVTTSRLNPNRFFIAQSNSPTISSNTSTISSSSSSSSSSRRPAVSPRRWRGADEGHLLAGWRKLSRRA